MSYREIPEKGILGGRKNLQGNPVRGGCPSQRVENDCLSKFQPANQWSMSGVWHWIWGLEATSSPCLGVIKASHACVHAQPLQSCRALCATLQTVALSRGFSRQEYCSGLPCPPPEHLHDPGIKPRSPVSPALQVDYLPLGHLGSQMDTHYYI